MSGRVKPADLCKRLMWADSEAEVVAILSEAGYWSDARAWRYIGDTDNNFSTIGNQQSEAVAALVEKVVNGVDARLVNECLLAGVEPESTGAPKSIREAVALFFEDKSSFKPEQDGRIWLWPDTKATGEGRKLTLAATGNKPEDGRPSLTIADQGEGQTPDSFPATFMSLARSNKLRIHFVQGKYNMGGTGALNFCSERHRLQLIVSRRNPRLLGDDASPRDHEWGFTVVRRQAGADGARSSVYTYLAPLQFGDELLGRILSFSAEEWPIFPEDPALENQGAEPYARMSSHGSLVKLYEYQWRGTKSNIVSSGEGLLRRVDLALPELALPMRLFECRAYRGRSASYSTNAMGLAARLDRDRADNIEEGFPIGANLVLDGKRIRVRVYAFKEGRARQYRQRRYGVVFIINGQMHAAFPTDFFTRKAVNLSYLSDDLLVIVDCSHIDEIMREDLFMNSRDRLRDTPLAQRMEEELQSFLKAEPSLRSLQNRRREERLADRLKNDQPLADVLQGILKSNPLLSRLFSQGLRLSSPFPPSSGAGEGSAETFEGRQFPTYFRFKGRASGMGLSREAQLGRRVRIAFETDAADDYFYRDVSPGACRVRFRADGMLMDAPDWTTAGPKSGIAQLWIHDLPEGIGAGDEVEYTIEVTDDSRTDAFVNTVTLRVMPAVPTSGGGGGASKNRNVGDGKGGSGAQLALPPITEVHKEDWEKHGFDEDSALRIVLADSAESAGGDVFDFYVNVDNKYLRVAQKDGRRDALLQEKQFLYGMVLTGLALIEGYKAAGNGSGASESSLSIEDAVALATRSLAPVFLPMLDAVGGLVVDEGDQSAG